MVVPGPPKITYSPGQSVTEGTVVSLTCKSDTGDVENTEVVWIKSQQRIEGDVSKNPGSISNVILLPASITDNNARYECHVIHPNLPEPLIDYGELQGMYVWSQLNQSYLWQLQLLANECEWQTPTVTLAVSGSIQLWVKR